jgi:eukaryotic-like serine/threonine-protein kinase
MTKKKFYSQDTLPNLTEVSSFPNPSMVGPYHIESQLTKGGMSFLYLATHPKSDEPVVVKILSPKFITNKEMVNRFLKEAEIISMTDHPNIVKLYDQGNWEKGLFIAMEFVQGISLRQFILQKSLSQKRALQIIQEVAYALLHLHTHGVIHRDLKPENILITESGSVKVIDFGIAQLHTELSKTVNNKAGKVIGTPIYMSPEQKKNPDTVSFVSDIYSLGIIIYELVLGQLSHGIIHLSFLPQGLRSIVEKALQVDPNNRYQDIVDLITAINNYLKVLNEKKLNEPFKDIFETFLQDKDIFFKETIPSWPQIEIGFEKQKGISLTGYYLDFFKLSESSYLIIMAEPTVEGPSSFISTASLKGIIQAQLSEFKDQNFDLTTFATNLNKIFYKILSSYQFECTFLLLNTDEGLLSLISCKGPPVYHYCSRIKNLNEFNSLNDFIGKDITRSFLETSDNWQANDLLFIPSKKIKKTPNFQLLIQDNLLLSPQNLTEKILRETYNKNNTHKRSAALLCIMRIF